MRFYSKCLLIYVKVLIVAASTFAKAQQHVWTDIDQIYNLDDLTYYGLTCAPNGRMYLGGELGLTTFENSRFKSLVHPFQKGNSVFNLHYDADGLIWYNNLAGQYFRVEDGREPELIFEAKNLNGNSFQSFHTLNDKIYILHNRELIIIDSATGKKVQVPSQLDRRYITSLNAQDGVLYLVDVALNIWRLDGNGRLGKLCSLESKTSDPFNLRILFIKSIEKWLVFSHRTNGQAYLVDSHGNTEKIMLPLPEDTVIHKGRILGGKIFFGTDRGLYIVQLFNGQFKIDTLELADITVTDVAIDKDNLLWVTTLGNGLKVRPFKNPMTFLAPEHLGLKPSDRILSTASDGTDALFYLTKSGALGKYDTSTGQNYYVFQLHTNLENGKVEVSGNYVFLFLQKMLLILDEDFNVVERRKIIKPKQVVFTDSLSFFTSSYQSLFYSAPDTTYSLLHRRCEGIFSTGTEVLVSLYDGLYYFNDDQIDQQVTIPDSNPYFQKFVRHGDLILGGTPTKGIYSIQQNVGIKWMDNESGLLGSRLIDITARDDRLLTWTDGGLQLMGPEVDLQSFLPITGIPIVNGIGAHLFDQKVVLSTTSGIYIQEIEPLNQNKNPDVNPLDIFEVKDVNVELPPHQTYYHFLPKILSATRSENIKIQTRHDDASDWQTVALGKNGITFQDLPYGESKFHLRLFDPLTAIAGPIKDLTLYRQSPFYLHSWFILLSILVVLILITLVYHWDRSRRERNFQSKLHLAQMENAMIGLKLENLRSQMNPHFVFNSLTAVQNKVLTGDKKNAASHLSKLAKLMRHYLDHSRENLISLQEEVQMLKTYLKLENSRFPSLNWKLNVPAELNSNKIKVPTVFIQPYVENAILHGLKNKEGEKLLTVQFKLQDNTLVVTVTDNGVGRSNISKLNEEMQQRRSFASLANRQRLELLRKQFQQDYTVKVIDLLDDHGLAAGTQIVINIPQNL